MECSNDLGVAPLISSKEAESQTPLPAMKLVMLFHASVLRMPETIQDSLMVVPLKRMFWLPSITITF